MWGEPELEPLRSIFFCESQSLSFLYSLLGLELLGFNLRTKAWQHKLQPSAMSSLEWDATLLSIYICFFHRIAQQDTIKAKFWIGVKTSVQVNVNSFSFRFTLFSVDIALNTKMRQ